MPDNYVRTIPLEGPFPLKIYDGSKEIIGDRCNVVLVIKMEIDIAKTFEINPSPDNLEDLISRLGPTVTYEKRIERIFIDEKDKEQVFAELLEEYMSSAQPYLSKATFASKFIRQKYRESRKMTTESERTGPA